jgi:hypothetical protein
MRRRPYSWFPVRILIACIAGVALAPACGGAVTSVLGPGGGEQGDSGGTGGPVDSGTTAIDTGSTGPVDSGTTTVDVVTSIDSSTPVDSAPVDEQPATGPAVLCPDMGSPMSCQPGEICCIQGDPTQGMQTDTCEAPNQGCTPGTRVRCAMTADCPTGDVCCGSETTVAGVTTYTEVSCAKTCTGTTQRIFCDPQVNDCPPQTPTCGQSQLLPGYNVCQ